MKQLSIILAAALMLAGTYTTSAQSETQHSYYKLKFKTRLQECDYQGGTAGFVSKDIPGGSKFTIVSTTSNAFIIRFWRWDNTMNNANVTAQTNTAVLTDQDKADNFNYYYQSGNAVLRYFLMPKADLGFQAKVLLPTFSAMAGTAVLPFKLRPQNGNFSKDITLSNMVGVKYNIEEHFSIGYMMGIGLTSVTLDSTVTNGTLTSASDRAAITLPLGIIVQYQGIQVGLFTGWDWLSSSDVNNWIYQGRPWLSLGLGLSIFKDDLSKSKEQKN